MSVAPLHADRSCQAIVTDSEDRCPMVPPGPGAVVGAAGRRVSYSHAALWRVACTRRSMKSVIQVKEEHDAKLPAP